MMLKDYNDFFNDYDAELARQEAKLPHCDYCDEAIHEKYYEINGKIFCEKCLEDLFAHWVEDEID
jgi:formylmethanofuran dehydrogenase subunit E